MFELCNSGNNTKANTRKCYNANGQICKGLTLEVIYLEEKTLLKETG